MTPCVNQLWSQSRLKFSTVSRTDTRFSNDVTSVKLHPFYLKAEADPASEALSLLAWNGGYVQNYSNEYCHTALAESFKDELRCSGSQIDKMEMIHKAHPWLLPAPLLLLFQRFCCLITLNWFQLLPCIIHHTGWFSVLLSPNYVHW
jgi:hypothetical protein